MATKTKKTDSTKPTKGAFGKPAEKESTSDLPHFAPLSLDAQKDAGIGRVTKWDEGTKLQLAEDCLVIEVAEHNVENAPKLLLKRVGKKVVGKMGDAQKKALLPKGTKLEYVGRQHVRTRIGESKGERTEVEVRLDVFKFTNGKEWLVCGDKSMVEVAA